MDEKECIICKKKFKPRTVKNICCSDKNCKKELVKYHKRQWYLRDRENIIKRVKQWNKDNRKSRNKYLRDRNKKLYDEGIDYRKKWINANPDKRKAHMKISALKIKYPELFSGVCCICGCDENIQYHHNDYSCPLSVYALCIKHHAMVHTGKIALDDDMVENKILKLIN